MALHKKKKKFSIRNLIINVASSILVLLALALIFNSSIRNMVMV